MVYRIPCPILLLFISGLETFKQEGQAQIFGTTYVLQILMVSGAGQFNTTHVLQILMVSGAGQFNIRTTEAILDNCFTRLVFYSLPCFPMGSIIF